MRFGVILKRGISRRSSDSTTSKKKLSPYEARDLSADGLVAALKALGYQVARQTGSHLRLTTRQHDEHHLTIP